jgi:hypothetical protein
MIMSKEPQEITEDEIIDEETNLPVTQESEKLMVKREVLEWDKMMEMAEFLSKSTVIPISYQNRPENILICVDLASRMGLSPLAVMQNLYIIQGKPSFSGQAIASLIRSSGQFSNVEVNFVGEEGKDSWGCYVSAERNGKTLKGATVTMKMAHAEGWSKKSGSKWLTMPEIMLTYRAYTFFGRQFAPELMMGLHAVEELEDIGVKTEKVKVVNPFD